MLTAADILYDRQQKPGGIIIVLREIIPLSGQVRIQASGVRRQHPRQLI